MKIGILTYHRATNYGAVLQAYSLISFLKKKFPTHSFELIDYATKRASIDHKKEELSGLLRLGFGHYFEIKRKNAMFKKFSDSLPLSKKHFCSDNITSLFKYMNKEYEAIIVGSDAVFSWNGKRFPTAYFLDKDSKYIKISYAASAHRLFYRDATIKQIEYCKNTLNTYDYIGVRDDETKSFVQFMCGNNISIHHNCDPTFLIDLDLLKKQFDINALYLKYNIDKDKKIIIVMSADEEIGRIVRDNFRNEDYFIISLFVKNKFIDCFIPDLSPFEWAVIFSIAELTITEYFHATILSLLNCTPTISIDMLPYSSSYEGKIKDLMFTRLSLPDLYLNIDDIKNGNYHKIVECADLVLSSKDDVKKRIKKSVENEKGHFDAFLGYLNGILNE